MTSSPPTALRQALDLDALCQDNPCDTVHVMGSFWLGSRTSFESHVAKGFKECVPTASFEPHISALCEFYASLILGAAGGQRFDWIVRVLGSGEKDPDAARPLSLLADMLCKECGARNLSHLFFKTDSRPSMRSVPRLSGPDALKSRLRYVSQDLFIRPAAVGGSVLLIDDIYNTGASMRVYAHALKQYAGVESVAGVNLAATRFRSGKDGHGRLMLDTSGLERSPGLGPVWLDSECVFHATADCASVQAPSTVEMRFLAERKGKPCPECLARETPKRKWWQW